jgi:hypothetical protein
VQKLRIIAIVTGAILTLVLATGCTRATSGGDAPAVPDTGQKAVATRGSSAPKTQTACALLTPGEIAGFLKVPQVKKDELNSGKNEMTKVDLCNWYVREGTSDGIQVTLRRAESADEGSEMLIFSAAKGDAVEHDVERDRKAQPLSGVGDEAIYSPYPVGNGGSIALRAGSSAVTITGSASKDTLVAMAKMAAQRL